MKPTQLSIWASLNVDAGVTQTLSAYLLCLSAMYELSSFRSKGIKIISQNIFLVLQIPGALKSLKEKHTIYQLPRSTRNMQRIWNFINKNEYINKVMYA